MLKNDQFFYSQRAVLPAICHCWNYLEKLIENIENDGKKVTEWFSKNKMVCSGDKTKLLVTRTRANRRAKVRDEQEVVVCGDIVKESESEKLLGLVVNNTVTWKGHHTVRKRRKGYLKTYQKELEC